MVVVLTGIDQSHIVEAALADPALAETMVLRFEPDCSAPCDALLWRLETASGDSLSHARLLQRHWHRRPYALTLQLVQYAPGSTTPEILQSIAWRCVWFAMPHWGTPADPVVPNRHHGLMACLVGSIISTCAGKTGS
jgi:hypothetical protein